MKLKLSITFLLLVNFSQLNAQKWNQYSDSIWVYFQKSDVKNTTKYLDLANSELSKITIIEDSIYANYLLRKGLSASLFNKNYNVDDLSKSLSIYEKIRFKDPNKFFVLNNFIGSYYYYNSIESKSEDDYKKAFYHLKKSNDYLIKNNLRNDFILKKQLYSLAFLESVIFKNQTNAKKYLIDFMKVQDFESSVKNTDMSYLSLLSFAGETELKEKTILAYINEVKNKVEVNHYGLFRLYLEMLTIKDRSATFKTNCLEVIKYGELAYNEWENNKLPISSDLKTIFIDLRYAYILINDNLNFEKFKSLEERYFPNDREKDIYQELDELFSSGDFILTKQKFDLTEQTFKSEDNINELIKLYRQSISYYERGVIFNKKEIQDQTNYIKINQSKVGPSFKILFDKLMIDYNISIGAFYEAHNIVSKHINHENIEERLYFLSLNGILCTSLGRFPEAKRSYSIAIELVENQYGDKDPRLLPFLTNAILADVDGSQPSSLNLVSRTLNLLYDNNLSKTKTSADAWKALGKMAHANYNYTDALTYLKRNQDIILSNTKERGFYANYITSILGIFSVYLDMKEFDKAKEQLDLASVEILKNKNSPSIILGDYHFAHATYFYYRGEFEKATTNYSKAFEYYGKEMSKPYRLNYIISDYLISRNTNSTLEQLNLLQADLPSNEAINFVKYLIMYKNGDNENAQKLLLSNIKAIINRFDKGFHLMSDLQRETLYIKNSLNFEFLNSYLLEEKPDFLKEYIDIRFYTKALLLTNTFKPDINNSKQAELLNLWKKNNEKIEYYTEKKIYEDSLSNFQLVNREIEQILVSEKEKLATPTLKTLTTVLNKGEAYVEIIRIKKQSTKVDRVGPDLINVFSDSIIYGAIVIKKNSPPKFIVIDDKSDLEDKFISTYKSNIINKRLDNVSYFNLYEKIDKELQGIGKIYFVPDGGYNLLNLETIYNPKIKKFLLEYIDVNVVTGCRAVIEEKTSKYKEIKTVSLFGSPIFLIRDKNKNPNKYPEIVSSEYNNNLRGVKLSYLIGAEKEISEVSEIAKKNNINVELYTGLNSSEDNLKKVNSPDILHIATHGYFYDANDSNNNKNTINDILKNKTLPIGQSNSGLFLTGAQNTINGQQFSNSNNGILTSTEVKGLNLFNTNLVVLSACETGLGDNILGEGVLGLQRSFLTAGAKSLIMSLWKVNDSSTRFLMTTFYENLFVHKMSKLQAFKQAKVKIMKKYPNPFDWGGFLLLQ